MKERILTILSLLGGFIGSAVGGFDYGVQTLLIIMAIDYATGLILAGVFHNSPKTKNGGLQSSVGAKGLFKKIVIIGIVAIAYRIDGVLGTSFVREACVIGFTLNELLSVIENVGAMGIPLPKAITTAIELLRAKVGDDNDK